jgi:hypothetical protein
MSELKYSNLLHTNIFRPHKEGVDSVGTRHLDFFGEGHFNMDCIFVKQPFLMIPKPHQHDFPQYLCLLSSSADDAREFDAEVEFSLGSEGEKYIITQPTIFYIPKELIHGPLNFAKVNKPVLLVDVALAGQYTRIGETYKP